MLYSTGKGHWKSGAKKYKQKAYLGSAPDEFELTFVQLENWSLSLCNF